MVALGELLGVGMTHFPPLAWPDASFAAALHYALADPDLPEALRTPAGWPDAMRQEWGDDAGAAAAVRHRAELVAGCDRVRAVIDAFAPDALVVVGDDQYENFREDVIPPFTILAYGDRVCAPWDPAQSTRPVPDNAWGEPADTTFLVRGRPDIARALVESLLTDEIDVAYAYEPLHHPGLPHAFMNTLLFLDYHRSGFDHAVVPLAVNCYGRRVIGRRGTMTRLALDAPFDPPSPSPARVMKLGATLAQAIVAGPWRIALVASSSWSHAFLCDHTYRLHPDTPADRRLYDALVVTDWDVWHEVTLDAVELAGQQELLNWFVLAGAMEAVGARPTWTEFVETAVFNSNKVFATFEPVASDGAA
ncbi:MAG TPA: extradiol ring-cleavage dioxygenase [Acidimicrobiia bacterium]|nr:extradiol ring-cleavage dioxygenase [Acidimicrobiia bacterium]